MAVYTKLEHQEVEQFLKQYNINNFKDYKGITEGVENTNYFIKTSEQDYILTIYEKRVDENDLPFFIKLLSSLSENKFPCPKPIANKNNEKINKIKNKNAALVTFLSGKSKNKITSEDCFQIGKIAAQLHELTKQLKLSRKNNLSIENWKSIFEKTRVGFGSPELSLRLSCTECSALSSGHGPRGQGFEVAWKTLNFP